MRFIQVFNRYLEPGGEETSAGRIGRHIALGGHEVVPFWRSSSEWRGSAAPSRLRQLFLLRDNPDVLEELRALQDKVHAHAWILHNVIPVVSLGVYALARQLGVPVIQWLHNYRPMSPGAALRAAGRDLRPEDPWGICKEILAGTWHGPLLTAWLALAYRQVRRRGDFESIRAWIAVSHSMREQFLRGGWSSERTFVLHHSWDVPQRRPESAGAGPGHFLFLGRVIEEKGIRFLVDLWAVPELRDLPLVVAGDGPLRKDLTRCGVPSIRWAGYVRGDAKRKLIAECRALLFPSLWSEPLSTVAYEAYEQSRPVVASASGGMKEIVLDRLTGRVLPAGDTEGWRQAVLELSRNAVLARTWGDAGRQWLEENVSPTAWLKRFEAIVEKSLGSVST